MAVYEVSGLPEAPLAAAASFHARHIPLIELGLAAAEGDLVITFPAADHTHHGWRLAAVQMLARAHAPLRINAVAGGNDAAVLAATRYIELAPGLTGQLIGLDPVGSGPVIAAAP